MLPNFLIIGAPRAGTTWTERNLREHPQVFLASPKEVHFFDRNYERGLAWYEQKFAGAESFPAVGEATPAYLHRPEVAERILGDLGPVKLIATLRDPVDRLYSRYWNARAKYEENRSLTFEEKIQRKPEFIHEGFYDDHLERYFDLFSRENVLVLFFEQLKESPQQFLRAITDFLEVEPEFPVPALRHKVNSAGSKPSLAKNKGLAYLDGALRRTGLRNVAERLQARNRADLPPMDAATRRWLAEEIYGPHNLRLARLLNVDLRCWQRGD